MANEETHFVSTAKGNQGGAWSRVGDKPVRKGGIWGDSLLRALSWTREESELDASTGSAQRGLENRDVPGRHDSIHRSAAAHKPRCRTPSARKKSVGGLSPVGDAAR